MAFGWTDVDFEIWKALGLDIGARTRQHFGAASSAVMPLRSVSAG